MTAGITATGAARVVLAVLAGCLALAPSGAPALDLPEDLPVGDHPAALSYIDFAVPDLAAFTMLGINQNQVARPANAKEFAAGLLNFVDTDGNMSTGLALEWAPFATLGTQTLHAYRRNHLIRRLQLSVASAAVGGGTSLAAGLRWVPIDRSDPLMNDELSRFVLDKLAELDAFAGDADERQAFNTELMAVLTDPRLGLGLEQAVELAGYLSLVPDPPVPPADPLVPEAAYARLDEAYRDRTGRSLAEVPQELQDELAALTRSYAAARIQQEVQLSQLKTLFTAQLRARKEAFKRQAWNDLVLHLSVGGTWNSANNSWKALRSDALVGFAGVSFPFTDHGQIIVHAQYDGGLATTEGVDGELNLGGRVLMGSSGFHVTAEYAHWWVEADTPEFDRDRSRVTAGLEFQVQEDLWLELGIGGEFVEGRSEFSDMLTLANVKYALGKKPRWTME